MGPTRALGPEDKWELSQKQWINIKITLLDMRQHSFVLSPHSLVSIHLSFSGLDFGIVYTPFKQTLPLWSVCECVSNQA